MNPTLVWVCAGCRAVYYSEPGYCTEADCHSTEFNPAALVPLEGYR